MNLIIKLKKQYEKYPEYKNSGVEWLGKIPKVWQISKAKTFVKFKTSGVWGDDAKGDSNDLPCLRVADFDYDKFTFKKVETVRNIPKNQQWKILKKSDILIEKSGGGEKQPVGRTIIFDSNEKMVCANFIDKVEVNTNVVPKFLTYLFSVAYSVGLNLKSIKQNTGIQNLDLTNYFNESFPQPSKPDQQKIADYLDEKVELIDKIRENKKKLIELLKEKQSAVIDNELRIKNYESRKIKLKYISDINKNTLSETVASDCILKYIDIGNVNFNGIINQPEELLFKNSPSRARRIVKDKSVIIATVRTYLKAIAYFENPENNTIVSTGFAVIDAKKGINNKFLYYSVLAESFIDKVVAYSTGVSYPAISPNILGGLVVSIPGEQTQKKIVEYLDQESEKSDNLIQKIEKSINLLSEYKSSLISNVVTGKVKIS